MMCPVPSVYSVDDVPPVGRSSIYSVDDGDGEHRLHYRRWGQGHIVYTVDVQKGAHHLLCLGLTPNKLGCVQLSFPDGMTR